MVTAYLGLGSNVGDRAGNLRRALDELVRPVRHIEGSPVYETEPQDVTDQPLFLNMVVRCVTNLSPDDLLEDLHRIEAELGRDRSAEQFRGPRPIDIDLLLYGTLIRTDVAPILPHPRMQQRAFVLVPLLDLDPTLADPVSGRPYAQILTLLPHQGIYSTNAHRYNRPSQR